MKIVVYSKNNCPNCENAKHLLGMKKLEYTETNVDDCPVALQALLEAYPDARQMPQIFINDQRVGGLLGLVAALKQLGL